MKSYKKPLLTQVSSAIAGILIIAGLLCSGFTIVDFVAHQQAGEVAPTSMAAGITTGFGMLFLAFCSFGMGQVIDYLGRTAYFAEAMEKKVTDALERLNREAIIQSDNLDDLLKTINERATDDAAFRAKALLFLHKMNAATENPSALLK
jgi:hypothetical protein